MLGRSVFGLGPMLSNGDVCVQPISYSKGLYPVDSRRKELNANSADGNRTSH